MRSILCQFVIASLTLNTKCSFRQITDWLYVCILTHFLNLVIVLIYRVLEVCLAQEGPQVLPDSVYVHLPFHLMLILLIICNCSMTWQLSLSNSDPCRVFLDLMGNLVLKETW